MGDIVRCLLATHTWSIEQVHKWCESTNSFTVMAPNVIGEKYIMGTICNRHTTDFTLILLKSSSNRIANLCSYIIWLLEVLKYLQKYSFGFPISSCRKAPCTHLLNIANLMPLYTIHWSWTSKSTAAVGNIGSNMALEYQKFLDSLSYTMKLRMKRFVLPTPLWCCTDWHKMWLLPMYVAMPPCANHQLVMLKALWSTYSQGVPSESWAPCANLNYDWYIKL